VQGASVVDGEAEVVEYDVLVDGLVVDGADELVAGYEVLGEGLLVAGAVVVPALVVGIVGACVVVTSG
jgi:hypothetical protein